MKFSFNCNTKNRQFAHHCSNLVALHVKKTIRLSLRL